MQYFDSKMGFICDSFAQQRININKIKTQQSPLRRVLAYVKTLTFNNIFHVRPFNFF